MTSGVSRHSQLLELVRGWAAPVKENYKRFIKPLRVVYMVALVGLIAVYLVRNWAEIGEFTRDTGFTASVLVVGAVIVGKVMYSEQARMAYLLGDGPRVAAGPFYRIYTLSDMAKYIPGGVWGVAARVNSYLRLGLSGREAARVFGLEKASLIVGAGFGGAACVTLGLDGGLRGLAGFDVSIGGVGRSVELALVLMAWAGLIGLVGQAMSVANFGPAKIARIVVEHSAISVFLGLTVWIPTEAIDGNVSFWLAVGAFNIGRAVGLAAVFAPAGIGVREAVGLWVLRSQDADNVALFAFGASRVLTTVAEVLAFVVVGLVVRSGRMSLPNAETSGVIENP